MTPNNDAWVAVYTTPTCQDCHAFKAWLKARGVPFAEKDLTDIDIMTEVRQTTGVRVAPITIIGEKVFFGTFASQKPGIVEALGLSNPTLLARGWDRHWSRIGNMSFAICAYVQMGSGRICIASAIA